MQKTCSSEVETMAKINVFMTYTPFHMLTACSMASRMPIEDEKVLISFGDFLDVDMYRNCIVRWKANPFKMHYIDKGLQFDKKGLVEKYKFSKGKLDAVNRFWERNLKGKDFDVYTFNDDTVESQFLLSKNNTSRNFYVEDGLSSYYTTPGYKGIKFLAKKIARKALFGRWAERPYPYGTSKKVSKVFSFFPEHVVAELKRKEVVQLPKDTFDTIVGNGLVEIVQKKFGMEPIVDTMPVRPVKTKGILLAPLYFQIGSNARMVEYVKRGIDFIRKSGVAKADIYIKCHPRETSPVEDTIAICFDEFNMLPKSASVELLFMAMAGKCDLILAGQASSAFITARVILGPRVSMTCVYRNAGPSTTVSRFFKDFGVKERPLMA
jgi:hypothetical protein